VRRPRQCDRRGRGQGGCRPARRSGEQIGPGERHRPGDTDLWQVRVAVRRRLKADLHQPHRRRECEAEPEPARQHVRRPAAQCERRARERRSKADGGRDPDVDPVLELWIHGPEPDRQEGAPERVQHRGDGVRKAFREGDLELHRVQLRAQGHERRRRGERGKGQLLEQAAPVERPPERPEVEHQQQDRQRDEHRLRQDPKRHADERSRVAAPAPGARVRDPRVQREQAEQRAEQVLALRDPRHRLDVLRVEREQQRGRSARALPCSEARQQREHERRAERVQQGVLQVRRGSARAEQAHVDHVREPGERVPIAGVEGGEGPGHAVEREPARDVRIAGDVLLVVEAQERERAHRRVHPERYGGDQRRDLRARQIRHGGQSTRGERRDNAAREAV